MHYTVSYEQGLEYTNAAMSFMAKHGVTPNPATIAVWYDYVSGRDPSVIWAIDKTLKKQDKMTTERCEEIYDQYIANESKERTLQGASDQLQASMKQVRDCIGEAGRDHGAYGKTLIGISTRLEGSSTAEEVAGLVRGILSETKQVIEKNKALENRLAETSREVDALQENLLDVRRQAVTDPLTGIANRKYFDALLEEETDKATEQGGALSLLFADIENFRAFKALYGSQVGDEVIKFVAVLLEQLVGDGNTTARYGGEEFAVILPQVTPEEGSRLAYRIREGLASRKLKNLKTGERYGAVSMSIGIATFQAGEPPERFVQRASEALYKAKEKQLAQVAAQPQSERAAGAKD